MEEKVLELLKITFLVIPRETEFWSAIAGAVVGGLIAYIVQVKALREGRRYRDEDQQRSQQALGRALLFKMVKIYSNIYVIHQHIEECFEQGARRDPKIEPWQFILPIVNYPDPIHFSSDEMGMLLGLRNDTVFNLVISMDAIHNSLVDTIKLMDNERRNLTRQLTLHVVEVEGTIIHGAYKKDQMLVHKPQMIDVNSLAENARTNAKRDFEESDKALDGLQNLLKEKLGLAYKLESKAPGRLNVNPIPPSSSPSPRP